MKRFDFLRIRTLLAVLFVLWTVSFLFNDAGYFTLRDLEKETQALREEVQKKQKTVDSLETVLHRLETDTVYIRRTIKSELGYIDSGETLIRFMEEK
ncbi:MAG: FtsB family cell division protein [Fibrobacterota bacterium]